MGILGNLYNSTPQGAVRQSDSGALIFPVNPREREAEKNREELKKELSEVKALKKELEELKKELRGE